MATDVDEVPAPAGFSSMSNLWSLSPHSLPATDSRNGHLGILLGLKKRLMDFLGLTGWLFGAAARLRFPDALLSSADFGAMSLGLALSRGGSRRRPDGAPIG